MNISYFTGVKNKTSKGIITVNDFISGVKLGKWKTETERIINCETKEQRDVLKREIASCVTLSGTFITRGENNLIEHSGFICIDFDGFDFSKYDLIKNDIYTYASFKSISGKGIAVIVKINKDKHKESFTFLQRHYFASYGCVIDPAPSNVASLRFVTYDPEAYFNEKSKQSKTFVDKKPTKSQSIPVVYGDDEVSTLVRKAVQSGVNLAPDYATYRDLAFSLAEGFGEGGRCWFHNLCEADTKYNAEQADKQYNIALKGKGRIGVGTFYWMLKNAGITLPKHDSVAQSSVMIAKKSNRSQESAVMQLVEVNGFEKQKAEQLVSEVYDREDIDLRQMSKDPERLVESLTYYLHTNWEIKKNAITCKYEMNGNEINEEDFNSIFLKCRSSFGSNSVTWELTNTIMRSNFTTKYNPIKEYIEQNQYRNSTGNIDRLCDSINTFTPNYQLFIRKWLISIAAAIDGKPVRSVLAFVGGQNTGKTEWFRRLLPRQLSKYYAESKLDAGKDDDLLMCQKLIVMDDEMGGKSKQDEKRFKELTSKQIFSIRAPYARANEDFKRLAVLCGTSNDKDVINDPTGNTRIFPVDIISLNHDKFNAIDKDDLFIEIIKLYDSGEAYELTRDELIELGLVSDNHTSLSIEQAAIDRFFRKPSEMPNNPTYFLSAFEIKSYIEVHSTTKINNSKRFSQYLTKTFGDSLLRKISGRVIRGYEVVKISIEENPYNQENYEENVPF